VTAAGYDENEEKEAATCLGWRRWLWVAVGRHGQWMAVERQRTSYLSRACACTGEKNSRERLL